MPDIIYDAFLQKQFEAALAFAAESDRVSILPGHGTPPCVYQVHYDARCLIRDPRGQVRVHDGFGVRICMPEDYLRRVEPFRIVQWMYPRNVFACNVRGEAFAICVGRLEPGEELIDLIYQCHAIGTWNKLTMSETDALNHDACVWARRHPHRYPVDNRPLKRAAAGFEIAVSGAEAPA